MAKKKMRVGEAVIEFYASLDLIKEYYEQKGYRKITLLHRALKDKLNWKMEYDTFRYHFNKEFKDIKSSHSLKKEKIELNIKEKDTPEKEPIIAYPSFSKVKRFVPYFEKQS